MYKRLFLSLVLLAFSILVVECGGRKKPTPVPTLPNTTVVALTPTPRPNVPAIPKYLPTAAAFTPTPQNPPSTPKAPAVSPTETPTRSEARVEVVVNRAYAYNGPGETFVPVAVAVAGTQLIVEERSPDGKWLHACCFAGRPGWISLKDVRPLTGLDDVPVATNVPSPPNVSPLPSPTPGG